MSNHRFQKRIAVLLTVLLTLQCFAPVLQNEHLFQGGLTASAAQTSSAWKSTNFKSLRSSMQAFLLRSTTQQSEQMDRNGDGVVNVLDLAVEKRDLLTAQTTTTTTSTTTTVTTTTTTTTVTTTAPITTMTTPGPTTASTAATTVTTVTTTTPVVTTVTTTTTTAVSHSITNIPSILQASSPALPTGCEPTALAVMLNYYGFNVTKNELASTYLPKMSFYTSGDVSYGADFRYVFAGSPDSSYSYGCYAPCIRAAAMAYFTAKKNASTAEILEGRTLDELLTYVAKDQPVMVWATMGLVASSNGKAWTTPDGRTVTWLRNEHCMVLTGYNYANKTITVIDPQKGSVTYSMDLFATRYKEMGSQALVLHPTTVASAGCASLKNGGVYRLRNAATGKYLTVAAGKDANLTNIIQSDGVAGSVAQQFTLVYNSTTNSYKIRANCSATRVLDIVKLGGSCVGGCNVELYAPTDIIAQEWVFTDLGAGSYRISARTNQNAYLATYGAGNGTQTGIAYNADGNVCLQSPAESPSQEWILTLVS